MSSYVEDFIDTSVWVPIHALPGFECCVEYYINRKGEVLSTKRKPPKLLKASASIDGYPLVTLAQLIGRKKAITVAVHKLVAFAFLSKPPMPYGNKKGCCNIDHIDDDKLNNNSENLCWISVKDNTTKKPYPRGSGHIKSEPSEADLRHRVAASKYERKIRTNPDHLERNRAYKREWMRCKRAAEKSLKIERSDDEK